MKKGTILIILLFSAVLTGMSQNLEMPLWPGNIPNHKKSSETETQRKEAILWIEKVQTPNIAVYLPTKRTATGQAVVICPGGGYSGLAYDWEGSDIAKWFNAKGIAAVVLKYRLPGAASVVTRHLAPLQDAQRAMRLTRHHAKEWNIDPQKIGIMGFSAGGHLASTLGTQFDTPAYAASDEIDKLSARPDFMVLIYPVISMINAGTHTGSRKNLLGDNPDQKLMEQYSAELNVKPNTPPTFLLHSGDDEAVPVENSIVLYQALKAQGIPAEMHIYPNGGHGYSLALNKGYLQTWTDRLYDWLQQLHK